MLEYPAPPSLEKIFQCEFDFIESGFLTGEENMRLDTERASDVTNGKSKAMFRLYGWKPWAVSLGYNQKIDDIEQLACEKNGFDIVRRPTGGRAVLHANELTYCVVANLPKGLNMHEAYHEIHIFLHKAMENIGISTLSFQKSRPNLRNFYNSSTKSAACFASSAQYEIEFEGRKVVGSAQRLFGQTLLQHGSILLSPGHERLADVSNLESEEQKQKLKEFILAKSATLQDTVGRSISFNELSSAIRTSFFDCK